MIIESLGNLYIPYASVKVRSQGDVHLKVLINYFT